MSALVELVCAMAVRGWSGRVPGATRRRTRRDVFRGVVYEIVTKTRRVCSPLGVPGFRSAANESESD